MEKNFAAIGYFYNDENTQLADVPAEPKDVVAKVYEIVNASPAGTVLSAEDSAIVRAYLAAIGSASVTNSTDGALQGCEESEYAVEGAGAKLAVKSELECKGVWDRTRMQWTGKMTVAEEGGAGIISCEFTFTYASFTVTADGRVKVLYTSTHSRKYEGVYAESPIVSTFIGTSNNVQWGYFMGACCKVVTEEGVVVA